MLKFAGSAIIRFFVFPLSILCFSLSISNKAAAYPAVNRPSFRHPEFKTPEKLRGRVDFWKDIFAKYGKAQFVIHHREYPQAIFDVIDLADEAVGMNAVQFSNFRKAVEKKAVEEVRKAIEYLADDQQPETPLQRRISSSMQFLGPGTSKYKRLLSDDLIRTQTGIKEKYALSVQRAGRYLPIIEKIFTEEFGMPVELTRLPFIESSFDYTAYSSVGAAGIWQFMPKTGKIYMMVNNVVDERRDPIEASRAAAKYLREAYNRLGKWPLAVTSYNHGVAGVAKKVAKLGTSDIVKLIEHPDEKAFGFASSNFYPEFLAAIEIYDNYLEYFPGLEKEVPIRAKEVAIQRPVTASYMAQQLGVSIQSLQAVNYALSKGVWEGRSKIPAGYTLKVPTDKDLHLAYNRTSEAPPPLNIPPQPVEPAQSSSTIYGGLTYKVRRGDSLITIAKKYGVTVAELKSLNKMSSGSIKVGQTLVVKPKENSNAPIVTASTRAKAVETERPANIPVKKSQTYKVKSGDTLWAISIKFGVSIDAIKAANKGTIVGNSLSGGKTITIPAK